MIKHAVFIILSFLIIFSDPTYGQGGSCPKIKVGVQIKEVYPEVFDFLNKTNNIDKTSNAWLSEFGEILMSCLSENSPGIEFIYLSGNTNADYDYLFSSLIALYGSGEDVIVVPAYTIIEGDNVLEVPPVHGSEYTAYRVISSLIVNSNCFPARRYSLGTCIGMSDNIKRAILSSISEFGRGIEFILLERENERPIPPREPEVTTMLEPGKKYLSPLDEDKRKIKIYEKVISCNGVPAYFGPGYHAQPVRFPYKTDRGQVEPSEGCQLEFQNSDIQYILVNPSGYAVGEYTLKKGLDPLLEKITLSTCPLGNKPNIEKEVEIIIRGIKLEVEPDRKTIYIGEKTSVQIDMHEVDPDGMEDLSSCAGKEVEVKVTGLVDGIVSHKSGKMTLNEAGVAYIDYKAGKEDKQVKITATFTPPGYPEEAKGEASITVKPLDYEATLTIKGRYTNTEISSYSRESSSGIERGNTDLKEISEASFYVPLKLVNAGDMPMLNQRWEYYQPLDINLSSFNASYRLNKYDYANYNSSGFEQTIVHTKNPLNQKVAGKEYLLKSNIILFIDKATNKVVKIGTGGFPVEFYWNENKTTTGRQWSRDEEKPINISDHKTDTSPSQYDASPVEDEVIDPTFPDVEEAMRQYFKDLGTPLPVNIDIPEDESQKAEIQPDLLVKFGDGNTYIGGDGRKVIDNSEGSNIRRKEMTFMWQVTRKKK